MRYLITGVVLTLLTAPGIRAQRVIASVVPGELLKFDSNALQMTTQGIGQGDFSFSPNVVFTHDSLRGFVAYPGREEEDETRSANKVMAFDTITGEVLALIEVGQSPIQMTLTPDGNQIGVVSLFLQENTPSADNDFEPLEIGSISMIDVETFEVRTLDLDNVFFSVFNNIVFSTDGSTGFVASAGTDEILRFDVASMTEMGPRIQVTGATRPASLTMAFDGSFFTVVLPGSNVLVAEEVPDSIQIIDPVSFTIVDSIVPEPLEVERSDGTTAMIRHNFYGLNNLSITRDNKWGLIGDREFSTASAIPVLSVDHALIIDMEQREVAHVIDVGGGPSATALSPTSDLFALVSAIELSLIDPNEEGRRRFVSTGTSQFLESSRPRFTPDGERIYVASPILDLINAYSVSQAITTESIQVGRDFLRPQFNIPAGPLDLAFTPDGEVLSVVNFNGNNVELLEKTYRLTSPQMVADNVKETIDDETGEAIPIPDSERFFSGVAVTNHGDEDADLVMTAFGFLSDPAAEDTAFLISANPNPVTVCDEEEFGQTTISWDVTGVLEENEDEEEVEVRIDSATGPLFAQGERRGSAQTGEWVTEGMTFFLLNRLTGEVLDTVTILFTELGCPPPVIEISPNPIQVCEEGGTGTTTISWDATDISEEIEIREGAADGILLFEGGETGSRPTSGVTDGMVFVLVGSDGTELDRKTVTLTDAGCPFAVIQTLKPGEQLALLANSFLMTDSSLDPLTINFSGWVDLNSNEEGVSGVFLTFDANLNRIDGGPISKETLDLSILPEVRIRDGFSTQVDVVNPNNQGLGVIFDLFDLDGQFVASALQNVAPQGRISLPVQGNLDRLGLFDNSPATQRITASPNPIQVCEGTVGETTLNWNATGVAELTEVRVGSPDGDLLGEGEETGSAQTGEWVTDGMVFYLLDRETGEQLDFVTVHFTRTGCPAPVLSASSNPIRVCDMGLGQTTLTWNATDIATEVEIREASATGPVIASGDATGSVQTDRTITDGMVFVLVNAGDGSELDRLTLRLTQEGCLLTDFEDGYIRIASRGTVSFETMIDEKRMAVLGAQPVSHEETRFTIPHFAAFGGTDTVLKLIHPSSILVGNAMPDEDEEEGEVVEEPILVSVTLLDDWGAALTDTETLELADGVSLRVSVIDLFGLQDNGAVQSGWIEVTADVPGLVGSAEIQAFSGEALSAIPLQPVRNSRFVFSHLATGFGFSTGIAVVHSGPGSASVVLELRNPAGELLGTLGPVVLEPGNRLVGLISELFPGSGELSGGTVRVLSDVPVTGVELFYGDNQRVLSAVPPQAMD